MRFTGPYPYPVKNGQKWRVTCYPDEGKSFSRSFATKALGEKFMRDSLVVTGIQAVAERTDRPLDDVIDMAVEQGSFASRAPIDRVLDKLHSNRTLPLPKLVEMFIEAKEKGHDGKTPRRETTVARYSERLKVFTDFFEGRSLASITKDDMRAFRTHLLSTRKTRNAARNHLRMVSIFYNHLIDELDMRIANPCKKITIELSKDKDPAEVSEEEIYTDDEIEKLVKVLETRIERTNSLYFNTGGGIKGRAALRDALLISTLIYAGLRIGEALALEWDDIDMERRVINVTKTLTRFMKVQPVKTKAGRRVVVIPLPVLDLLKRWRMRTNHPVVFTTVEGNYIEHTNALKMWKLVVKEAGVPYHNPHKARHWFASKLIDKGYDDHRLTDMIGHEDISFTRRVYGHLLNKRTRIEKDVKDIDKVFPG
ncbi:site-specific integrase [Pseudaminobacter sp. 19-2017]|uniref:Site-specific integrase n=1 Tax=Pseudaminobacter soli (ex Zhang et al. 2022) TaxID=2831468 RepID=A0A942DX05_9HYPH|nr:tyrosine-type recombinase/integrase [Pseudaminobacter soli]MBS3648703.1 site-specific integrase [Pseudaminobacter soli]